MSLLRKVPGFRSGKRWKQITAIGGYGFLALVALASVAPKQPVADTPEAAQEQAAAEQPAAAARQQQASAAPARAADPNRGITFGTPALLGSGTLAQTGVLATNTTDQVKSFTAKATYKKGDTIVSTMSGAVNDLLPSQTRAATLIGTGGRPADYDTVRVDVDTMVREARSTPGADAARKITFGKPTVKTGGLAGVDVEVTNGDGAAHSFTAQAAFLKGGELLAVASGAVNDLAAGQTKTASLITTGSLAGYDEVKLAIETLVR